jgi:acetylglutamate kinase
VYGPLAVGLSGEDANLLRAQRRTVAVDGQQMDIGAVGDVVEVQTAVVADLIKKGRIPVISTVAADAAGVPHNVNADTAAAAVAQALQADRLVVLTDVPGLYADWPDRGSLVSRIDTAALAKLMPSLAEGMVPKMEACLRAVQGGVPQAQVIDGRQPHSVLREVLTHSGLGTVVVP